MVGFRDAPTTLNRSTSLQEHITCALESNFLLLHQPTPNAFILLDPVSQPQSIQPSCTQWNSPPQQEECEAPTRHRFRVTLGSQQCTCSEMLMTCQVSTRSPCVHILFVMLRVLRLSLDDPRVLKSCLANHEVEPLLQRYALLRAFNFRPSREPPSSEDRDMSSHANTFPVPRIVMPRPVVATTLHSSATLGAPSAFTSPRLLAAVQAAIGSSECSELSLITRSIMPEDRMVSMCRCASHASTASAEEVLLSKAGLFAATSQQRPKTEPQSINESTSSKLDQLSSTSARYSLSTTFRPIPNDLGSNAETDPDEAISSSSRSSRVENLPSPVQPLPPPQTTKAVLLLRSSLRRVSRQTKIPLAEESEGLACPHSGDACLHDMDANTELDTSCPHSRVCLHHQSAVSASPPSSLPIFPISDCQTHCVTPLCLLCLRGVDEGNSGLGVCSAIDCVAKYHQECFSIWQEECEKETGSLYCPVCGRVWTTVLTPTNPPLHPEGDEQTSAWAPLPSEPLPSLTSQSCVPINTMTTNNVMMTNTEIYLVPTVVPSNVQRQTLSISSSQESVNIWKNAFSGEIALGITSPSWHVRQSALRQVAKITICRVLMARQSSPIHQLHQSTDAVGVNDKAKGVDARLPHNLLQQSNIGPESLRMSFRLIQHLLSDPADEVFIASLCAFREILGYLICLDTDTLTALQRAICPVLRRLLIFVGGFLLPGNAHINANPVIPSRAGRTQLPNTYESEPADPKRRANLALATLVELAKGQEGEMSIGRDTSNADQCIPISGLNHLAHFLLSSKKFHQPHLVGRLTLLEKLVAMHRETPSSSKTSTEKRNISYRQLCSSLVFARRHVYPPEPPVFPNNYTSEAQVSSCGSLMEANLKASRLARRVFIAVARALLSESEQPTSSPTNQPGTISLPCAQHHVNSELRFFDKKLAAEFRLKLGELLRTPSPPPYQNWENNFEQSSPPPLPRRISLSTVTTQSQNMMPSAMTSLHFPSRPTARVAYEPAYDAVALSETAPYSSEEEEVEAPLEKVDWEEVGSDKKLKKRATPMSVMVNENKAPHATSEQHLAVLKTLVGRSGRPPNPLHAIPNLSVRLDRTIFQNPLKATCKYKEGVDWLLGPLLGRGAFAQCYQAQDIQTGTLMAVKRLRLGKAAYSYHAAGDGDEVIYADHKAPNEKNLSQEAMEQLNAVVAEVEIMRRVHHSNVLRLFGIAYQGNKKLVDIFLEWMPGASITSLLDQYGPFTEPVATAYSLQVVRGLACLHKNGILHRDLKGANLLVDGTGSVVRISDFGASARLGSQGSVAGQFQGQVIGTFAFMAPEVLRGDTYGRACDIWSVGCCFLEMLTGKPPWDDYQLTNQFALMFTIVACDHPPTYPISISPLVKSFLDSCFTRVPDQRPTVRKLLNHHVFDKFIESPEMTASGINSSNTLSRSITMTCSATMDDRPHGTNTRRRALPAVPQATYDKLTLSATNSHAANKTNHSSPTGYHPNRHQTMTCRK